MVKLTAEGHVTKLINCKSQYRSVHDLHTFFFQPVSSSRVREPFHPLPTLQLCLPPAQLSQVSWDKLPINFLNLWPLVLPNRLVLSSTQSTTATLLSSEPYTPCILCGSYHKCKIVPLIRVHTRISILLFVYPCRIVYKIIKKKNTCYLTLLCG